MAEAAAKQLWDAGALKLHNECWQKYHMRAAMHHWKPIGYEQLQLAMMLWQRNSNISIHQFVVRHAQVLAGILVASFQVFR